MRLIAPRLLERARRRVRAARFSPSFSRLKKEADAGLAAALSPGARQAGWYHDYFCPKHGTPLAFDHESPSRHACPEGHVLSGEPFDSAWLWFVNDRLSRTAYQCSLLWRLTDQERYLRGSLDILLAYARVYKHYRGQGSGKATRQSLDEAVWLIPLLWSFDATAEAASPRERGTIERDLLRPAVRHIIRQLLHSVHNIECWHRSALLTAGIVLQDRSWVRLGLTKRNGLEDQLRKGVLNDGFWFEGSPSYHFYALWALLWSARASVRLRKNPKIAEMLRAPFAIAFPDGSLPALNDCWRFSRLDGEVAHGTAPSAGYYELGYSWYGSRAFSTILNRIYRRGRRDCLEALLYGAAAIPRGEAGAAARSVVLRDSGYAVIRMGSRKDRPDYTLLKFGSHGGTHEHPDKLSLSLILRGRPVSTDLGTAGYGIPLHAWYRSTLAHNTVVVDGCSQPPTRGALLQFIDPDKGEFGLIDAGVTWIKGRFRGIRLRRILVQTPDYLLDVFQADSPSPRTFDWCFRIAGDLRRPLGPGKPAPAPGRAVEYSFLRGLREPPPSDRGELRWRSQNGGLKLLMGGSGSRLLLGQVPSNPPTESEGLVLRRETGRRAEFISLFHAYEARPSVDALATQRFHDGFRIVVEISGRKETWTVPLLDRIAPPALLRG